MKIDWKAVENEYITTTVPLRSLAEKYGVSDKALFLHCKKGEWVSKREAHHRKVSARILQKTAENAERVQDDFDRQMAMALSMLMEKTVEDIANAENIADRRIAVGNLKMIGEIMQSNKSFPRKMEEMQKRIDKMQAETKAIEDGVAVDHDVKIEFVNGEWMDDDTDTESNTKAD